MVHLDLAVRAELQARQELVVRVGQIVYNKVLKQTNNLELQTILGLLIRQGLRELPGLVHHQVILDLTGYVVQAVKQGIINQLEHKEIQELLGLVDQMIKQEQI